MHRFALSPLLSFPSTCLWWLERQQPCWTLKQPCAKDGGEESWMEPEMLMLIDLHQQLETLHLQTYFICNKNETLCLSHDTFYFLSYAVNPNEYADFISVFSAKFQINPTPRDLTFTLVRFYSSLVHSHQSWAHSWVFLWPQLSSQFSMKTLILVEFSKIDVFYHHND